MASPSDRPNVSSSKSHGVIVPVSAATARTAAITNIHISVPRISLRRSKMSPIEPAGSANRKNGNAEAVWIRAIKTGRWVSEVISRGGPNTLHEGPNVGDEVCDQQVAKNRDFKRVPRADRRLDGLGHRPLNLHQCRYKLRVLGDDFRRLYSRRCLACDLDHFIQ